MSPDRRVRTTIALLFILVSAAVCLTHWIAPDLPTLYSETTGSAALIAEIRDAHDDNVDRQNAVATAFIIDGKVTYARFGKKAE